MLRSTKKLCGGSLVALDGDVGTVKDFYFDDQTWTVRYVVAETGRWLTSRQVLLSPMALGNRYPAGKTLLVKLTRKQIEDSPPLEWHKPVSRQFEEDYHRHYGWPGYWQVDGSPAKTEFPILESPAAPPANEPELLMRPALNQADAHLRSAQAVMGYHLHATDGIIGHVADFLMDDQTWIIRQLVIKIGHRLSGREVQIPADKILRISYPESTVFVNLPGAAVEQGLPPANVAAPRGVQAVPDALLL